MSNQSAATGIIPAAAVRPAPPVAVPVPPAAPLPAALPLAASSRSAQLALVLIIALVIGLLGSHAIFSSRSGPPQPPLDARLDLNQATVEELSLLPGVGPGLADRIVAYRDRHGDFKTVDDLAKVSGVGPKTLERLRDKLLVPADGAAGRRQPLAVDKPLKPVNHTVKKPNGPIDPNSATLAELDTLPGVGPVIGQRIIEARAKRPFEKLEDLRRVKGIGPKTFEKIRPHLVIAAGA